MKKYLLIIISILLVYFISWGILGKGKLFEKEFTFIKQQEFYENDYKTIYLINFEYNYFIGQGFYDSLSVAMYTNQQVDTRMIEENLNKSFISFKVGAYNPFFINSTKSFWIYGTDGVFDYSTNYAWFFLDWIQISDTKYE